MVTYRKSLITENGRLTTELPYIGKIVKVFVKTNKITESRLRIVSSEFETIIDKKLEQEINIMYPFNDIARITPEQGMSDYFYIDGKLGIEIIGLKSDEWIEELRIFIV